MLTLFLCSVDRDNDKTDIMSFTVVRDRLDLREFLELIEEVEEVYLVRVPWGVPQLLPPPVVQLLLMTSGGTPIG